MYDNLLAGVNKQLAIQAKGTEQISSGTRFQRPADAGLDYKMSLDLRHAQVGVKGSLEAVKTAESRLGASQTMLNSMKNIMVRAQTLAVQQSSAGLGAAERSAAAIEVGHLLTQFANDANQKWQGQSLFSGTAVDKPSFTPDALGNYTYTGSSQDRIVAISDTLKVTSNIRGDNPSFGSALTALQGFKVALQNNDQVALQTSLSGLNSAGNSMIDLTSEVGGRLSALSVTRTSFEDMKFTLDKRINEHEAVDVPAIVAQLQQSSIALQASYSQISKVKSLSLINFLR
jgi:flagellin-like hook-associated protein FlgL